MVDLSSTPGFVCLATFALCSCISLQTKVYILYQLFLWYIKDNEHIINVVYKKYMPVKHDSEETGVYHIQN